MMINFSDVWEGWRNHIIPPRKMKKQIEAVSKERLKICRDCPHNSINAKKAGYITMRPEEHCTECGCVLVAKTKCLHCSCPLNKWTALLSEEESNKLKETLK